MLADFLTAVTEVAELPATEVTAATAMAATKLEGGADAAAGRDLGLLVGFKVGSGKGRSLRRADAEVEEVREDSPSGN